MPLFGSARNLEFSAAAALLVPLPAPVSQPATLQTASPARLPRHLAIVLDGNGRWATAKSLPRLAGHTRGIEAVRSTIRECLARGIEVLSLYAFSSLNWKRPAEEVQGLMALFQHYLSAEAQELAREGVRLKLLGERERLPVEVREALDASEAQTAGGSRLKLNLAVNYGGREELVRAVRQLAVEVASGGLAPEAIDEARVEGNLFTRGLPPVDFLIRTAGERRLSNFLLWQSAYAELLFLDVLWPDFSRDHFAAALADFATRRRTFGGLVDQRP